MGGELRPNRVQKQVCRQAVAEALGERAADVVLRDAGFADVPDLLPARPRDLDALAKELQPFVDLYHVLLDRTDRETALRVMRGAIVQSGAVSHANDAAVQERGVAEQSREPAAGRGLNLTSPPPPGFQAADGELRREFEVAMRFFSCEGRLLAYTPDFARFHITSCNWVRAMQRAGAPELIPFFCETDERFMDGHPTHRLDLPITIGRGASHCDFRFVPRVSARVEGKKS